MARSNEFWQQRLESACFHRKMLDEMIRKRSAVIVSKLEIVKVLRRSYRRQVLRREISSLQRSLRLMLHQRDQLVAQIPFFSARVEATTNRTVWDHILRPAEL